MKLRVLIAGVLFVAAAVAADSGAELFQKAVTQERAAGNLEEAIKLYQRVAKEFAADRPLAAKALVQAARCYEKLGQDKAVKIYEQVARDYGDQRELAAMATARLAVLRQGERAAEPVTMTQRKIDLPFAGYPGFASFSTDGRREVYTDPATGALMIVNLAGTDKRVIFKPKSGEHLGGYEPSRDFSMVVMYLAKPDGSYHSAVIKIDGTGYREIPASSSFYPGWSWDNRYLFTSTPTQHLRVSVADGAVRKVQENGDYYDVPSPDGRFIAVADLAALYRLGNISIVPIEGGPPQVAADKARLIDWTRDGRYLIIASERTGTEALYLLPITGGRPGDPIFVRYGSFTFGRTTPDGAVVYQSTPQGGGYAAWLGALDSGGRPVDWKRLSLSGTSQQSFNPKWSPDSTQIIYISPDEAVGKFTYALRLRNMASGEERELYRGIRANCIWVEAGPNLFCTQGQLDRFPTTVELLSISTASGHVEPLGPLADAWNGGVLFSGRDDQAIYMWRWLSPQGPQPVPELIRWDIGTREVTVVDRFPSPINGGTWLGPVPDEHWIARWDKGKIEIRPTPGGDWKPLISLDTTQTAFTPDGNWLIYHDVDAAGKQSLFRVSTAGGQPERIGDFPSASKQGNLRISPDGKQTIAEAPVAPEVWILENFEPKQQAARCYEKLGQDKAVKIYEQVARDYGDQRELAATANARLAVLRQGERAAEPVTMTQRKIEVPGASGQAYSEGQRALYRDAATGSLVISDLAGKNKRVVFKPKPGDSLSGFVPSRDLSVSLLATRPLDPKLSVAVIKTDGTGYREIAVGGLVNVAPNWSWDNRYVLVPAHFPDSTDRLLRITAADGQSVELLHNSAGISGVSYSPDSRFIAYSEGFPSAPASTFIVPSEGGEPQLIFANARVLDWTRDGHYLAVASPRSGVMALQLLPVKDGRSAGEPVFLRYGSVVAGRSSSSGALYYAAAHEGGFVLAWIADLGAEGHPGDWKRLMLGSNNGLVPVPQWSPDSSQIAWTSTNDDTGQTGYVIRSRNLATGKERELYRGASLTTCTWAARHPNLFCGEVVAGGGSTDILSIALDSGRSERLGSVPGRALMLPIPGPDDQAVYVGVPQRGLLRWDIGTRQETLLEPSWTNTTFDRPNVSPDGGWLARIEKGILEVRSLAGGDWRPLLPLRADSQSGFSPDGKWVFYHGVDAAGKDGLYRVATAGGSPQRLGEFPANKSLGLLSISPDGRKIIALSADLNVPDEAWLLENFEPKQQAAK